jgi:stage II sporulation protein M
MNFKRWLVVAVLLFSLGIVFGLFSPTGGSPMDEELAAFEELISMLAALPPGLLAILILLKNCTALLISFALSPLLCLSPFLTLTINGWLIGVITTEVVKNTSLGYLLAGLLPHGIFEIPALMIGEAAALSFGTSVLLGLLRKNSFAQVSSSFKKNLKYLMLAMLLMVPAALIETFITPLLLR